MTFERLAFLAVLAVFIALWLGESCSQSEDEAYARALGDSVQVLLDTLTVRQRKADSLEQRLTVERTRVDTVIRRERVVEQAGEARFAAAGDSLMATLDSIVVVAPEVLPLVETAKLQVRDRDAEHETVTDAIRAQMQAVVALQATTDSARAAWRDRALAAEEWGEAQERRAEAWKREANPGFLASLRSDLPKLGAAVAATAVVVLVVR